MSTFAPGDHIAIGRGPNGLVKHHAIVVAFSGPSHITIAEYGVFNSDGSKKILAGHALDVVKEHGEIRLRDVALNEGWKTVESSSPISKEPEDVVNAALFLVENGSQVLPQYHFTNSNGECVARWCKEGVFASTQANSLYKSVENTIEEKVAPNVHTRSTDKTTTAAVNKLAMAVSSVSAFVGKRHGNVETKWKATNERLDEAFATYLSAQM